MRHVGPAADGAIALQRGVQHVAPVISAVAALAVPPELGAELANVVGAAVVRRPAAGEIGLLRDRAARECQRERQRVEQKPCHRNLPFKVPWTADLVLRGV